MRKKLESRVHIVARWERLPKLWRHQRAAIRFCEQYLRLIPANMENAALVRMPTGTGKTGIMAVIANYLSSRTKILIIAPSSYLTFQLRDALNENFWVDINAQPKDGPRLAVDFTPSSLMKELEAPDTPEVLVCTTTTLQMLYSESREASDADDAGTWSEEYKMLLKWTGIILVDEGHREPAKEWARAVRSFRCPTVLFSATPYRNDLRFFKVGTDRKRYHHQFRFHQATARGVIRDVRFVPATQIYSHSPERDDRDTVGLGKAAKTFAKLLVRDFYAGELLRYVPPDVRTPKVIVRCETGAAVKAVKEAIEGELAAQIEIEKARSLVLAVHDQFKEKTREPNEYEEVPRRDTLADKYPEQAVYWVHQFKLTEGLDDRDFCAIAFFQPYRNARGLVQQIGRVLRSKAPSTIPALVFHDPAHDVKEQFDGYREFERSKRSIVGPEEIVSSIVESLPDWFYFDGRYREALEYRPRNDSENRRFAKEVMSGLQTKKSALVFVTSLVPESEDLPALLEEYTEALEEQDQVQMVPWHVERTGKLIVAATLHCRIEQTPYLRDRAFFDISLSPTIFCWRDGCFFLQGRTSAIPAWIVRNIESVQPNALEALLPAENTRITQVSLTNCDLGRSSVRRRAIAAYGLDEIAPGLADHFHFASAAVGALQRKDQELRRYLGFRRARVTEPEAETCGLDAFVEWAGGLATELNHAGRSKRHSVLNRFAAYVPAAPKEIARHILIEFDEFFRVYHSGLFPETFSSLAADVDPKTQEFACDVGAGKIVRGEVQYRRPRFKIVSEDLDRMEPRFDQTRTKPTTFLTQKSSFRIVTHEGKLYTSGSFYYPRQPLWQDGRVEDVALFHHIKALDNITSKEKGEKNQFTRRADGSLTWQQGSVFHVIDNDKALFAAAKFEPSLLICEDLGTEVGDFLALDLKNKRMCLIHAKAYDGKDRFSAGASPFHDVYAQVVKNLEFLNPIHSVAPERSQRWKGLWKWARKAKEGVPRIRRKPPTLNGDIPELVSEFIRSAETQKEVWVVLGNGFPIQDLLIDVARKGRLPEYHAVQLIYLLQSCSNQVSSVGARLRIFSVDHAPSPATPRRTRH